MSAPERELPGGPRPAWPARPAGLAYGGDYNPEQWPTEVHAEDVDVHDAAPLVEVEVLHRRRHERGVDPGVVDDDVDAAKSVERGLDETLTKVGLGHAAVC